MSKIKKISGLSPGSLIFTGEQKTKEIQITVLSYKEDKYHEKEISNINDLASFKENAEVSWINVSGLHDINILERIGNIFSIHPLTLEDILNVHQSPKIEDYDSYLFVVLKMINTNASGRLDIEQLSIIHGKNYVITFQEKSGSVFDPIKDRIRNNKGRLCKLGGDYLVYRLIDSVVDHYFFVLEKFDEQIEIIEDNILENPDETSIQSIHRSRKELIKLRRSIFPLREVLYTVEEEKFQLIKKETYIFIRDLADHVRRILDSIENYREIINGLLEVYLSSSSRKMNEIVKLLTIISTIFIPLTFIAGVYGMNFNTHISKWNMPELEWIFGYPAIMGFMFLIAVSLIFYFKRKGWFK